MSKTKTTRQRIAALKADGWTLVHSQAERLERLDADGHALLRPGITRFETTWRGRSHTVSAETLDAALDATEAEAARISTLGQHQLITLRRRNKKWQIFVTD